MEDASRLSRQSSDGGRWSAAEKQQVVAATLEPGASVSAVARERGFIPASCTAGGGSCG
jgi:transposase-like protein